MDECVQLIQTMRVETKGLHDRISARCEPYSKMPIAPEFFRRKIEEASRVRAKGDKIKMNSVDELVNQLEKDSCKYEVFLDEKTNVASAVFIMDPSTFTGNLKTVYKLTFDGTFNVIHAKSGFDCMGVLSVIYEDRSSEILAYMPFLHADTITFTRFLQFVKNETGDALLNRPILQFTDEDVAFIDACSVVFPNAKICICIWHKGVNFAKRRKSKAKLSKAKDSVATTTLVAENVPWDAKDDGDEEEQPEDSDGENAPQQNPVPYTRTYFGTLGEPAAVVAGVTPPESEKTWNGPTASRWFRYIRSAPTPLDCVARLALLCERFPSQRAYAETNLVQTIRYWAEPFFVWEEGSEMRWTNVSEGWFHSMKSERAGKNVYLANIPAFLRRVAVKRKTNDAVSATRELKGLSESRKADLAMKAVCDLYATALEPRSYALFLKQVELSRNVIVAQIEVTSSMLGASDRFTENDAVSLLTTASGSRFSLLLSGLCEVRTNQGIFRFHKNPSNHASSSNSTISGRRLFRVRTIDAKVGKQPRFVIVDNDGSVACSCGSPAEWLLPCRHVLGLIRFGILTTHPRYHVGVNHLKSKSSSSNETITCVGGVQQSMGMHSPRPILVRETASPHWGRLATSEWRSLLREISPSVLSYSQHGALETDAVTDELPMEDLVKHLMQQSRRHLSRIRSNREAVNEYAARCAACYDEILTKYGFPGGIGSADPNAAFVNPAPRNSSIAPADMMKLQSRKKRQRSDDS